MPMDVGLIGLGVMGENLILNMEEKGYKISVFNRTTSKTHCFIEKHKNKNISGHETLKEFVNSLTIPRKIILLIKSGDAVDSMIDNLIPLIAKNDLIIDAGNSFYEDTEKRYAKYKGKFLFLGVGISGGELGARHGPSIMVGGDMEGWNNIKPIFEQISAKSDNKPCCAYFGNSSSGHFVKMVHNGIEYCEMQLISEVYFLFKKSKMTNQRISEIFEKWLSEQELNSYLLEITQIILKREDNLIDKIMDKASQKGTGMQCVSTALNYSTVCTLMSDAVFSRIISSKKEMREHISKSYENVIDEDVCIDEKIVKSAFLIAKAVAY
ncbi:6-phosphogluconate dehydrogenase (decarboxylating), partial [Anncaliia algerae PRA109]